jgi:hypothetical protein
MKTSTRLAVVAATLTLVAGCNCLHHKQKPVREPVLLPGAPSLEPGPSASTVPSMSGPAPSQTYSPLSATAPVTPPGRN